MIMKTAKFIAVAVVGLIGVTPLRAEEKPANGLPPKGFVTEPSRQTPVLAEADVVVVGGGLSGIGAAVGAGRAGAKTVLIERKEDIWPSFKAFLGRDRALAEG